MRRIRWNTEHLYGIVSRGGFFAPMPLVYCRTCRNKVEDCEHFVMPIPGPRVSVFDERVSSLAYSDSERTLEIALKTGQAWQLFGVSSGIYEELRSSTISSFLKFIAHRYRMAPVKQGLNAIVVPRSEPCGRCGQEQMVRHRVNNVFDHQVRVLWECKKCQRTEWRQYSR